MEETIPMIERYRADYPEIEFRYTGSVPLGYQFNVASQDDGATLTPFDADHHAGYGGYLAENSNGVVGVTVVAILSALISLGSLGWAHIPLNSATALAPLMIITLAVATPCICYLLRGRLRIYIRP